MIGRRSLVKNAALLALGAHGLAAGVARAAPGQPTGGAVQMTPDRVLNQTAVPVFDFTVVKTHPHDTSSYTEGLVKAGGTIFEGTGLYGRSRLLEWDLESGRVLRRLDLDPNYFGEGVTVLDGRIYQLTYLDNRAFVYDQATFSKIGQLDYGTQGWGLTHDGTHLIMSNGSSMIEYRDPKTFRRVHRFYVSDAVAPVGFLNELEFARGRLYANVWQTPFIAIIDPAAGTLAGWIDLTGINPDPAALKYPYVLNGIAFDEATGNLLVTGKCWPHVWEIALVPRAG
ncbi:glutaminyl-peptide cyclotransferase [Xanthobacter tagetidis]|nr:glutaminyl-peptide cyclotransferase [Xanthobacter tagetidis]MBB6306799.1 glutamine cyclotransferase [Xanthobacter tagetidis]